jgi:WD40 repeat protein
MTGGRTSTSVRVSLSVALLAGVIWASIIVYLLLSGELSQLQVENARLIPLGMAAGSQLSEIWFSPTGRLFATFEKGGKLNIASWNLEGRQVRLLRTLSFPQSGGPEVPILANSFHGGSLDFIGSSPERLAYAVSNDGLSVAWAWKGEFFWGPIEKFGQIKGLKFGDDVPVSAVAIARPGIIIVLDYEDSFRILDLLNKKEMVGSRFKIGKGPRLVWGRDNFRVLSPVVTANAYLLSLVDRKFNGVPEISGGACFAVSGHGEMMAGTKDGIVISPAQRGPSQFAIPERLGRIRTLAFWDEQTAIAGGAGSGLFLVKDGSEVSLLEPTPEGVQFLAVEKKHIAYATSNRLIIGGLGTKFRLSDRAKWFLAIGFSFIGLLSFVRVILIDFFALSLRKRENTVKNEEMPPSIEAREDT